MKDAKATRALQEKAMNAYINAHLKLFQESVDASIRKFPMLGEATVLKLTIEKMCEKNGYYCNPYFPHEVTRALEKKGYKVNVHKDVDRYLWVTISW